jgi:hypothetical protein
MWVTIRGGLGNQMFQAAYATALGNRFGVKPRFVNLAGAARVSRGWELNAFGITADPVSAFTRARLAAMAAADLKLQRLGLGGWPGVVSEHAEYAAPPRLERAPGILAGYWQGERYFAESAAEVRALFRTLPPTEAPPLPDFDPARPLVAIHVRRGDYVSDPVARALHLVCDENWYRAAWAEMRRTAPMARGLVFSDDPDWARENLALEGDVQYGAGSPGMPAWVDLARMASCQHFVISNSSYSWWAAWLGTHPVKRVIAPREWFRGRATAALGLCPTDWVLL